MSETEEASATALEINSKKEEYPLHWLVWHNDFNELERVLAVKKVSFLSLL